ncbi:MAG TPA: glycosyltransferase [Rhodanobacter sp.]|nr:glycosyltransferase [Rhodanobacter sp.]
MTAQRILFVSHTGQLGGAEFVLLDIARHYRDRCHVVLLADGPLRSLLAASSISVGVVPADHAMLSVRRQGQVLSALSVVPAALSAAWHVARAARGYDILYPNSQKAAVVTMLAGQLLHKPVVWHLHDILSLDHFGRVQRRAVMTLANRSAKWIVTNSEASRDAFVACGGKADRITVVPNGIDAAPFVAISDAVAARLRREFGAAGCRLVGVFGRLAPWKGQHLLIEALPKLPGVHALVVGDALFGETDYRAQLEERAGVLGVSERVHMLGFRNDVPALMRSADVIAHTSTAPEPFGRVLVEGMLAQRPVVAASGGGAREVLGATYEHIVPPGDPTALADAIARVLATPQDAAATLAAANFARATKLFSIERMLSGIDRALAQAA